MLSTLDYLFHGEKSLFSGLQIESEGYDFCDTYPVVHLDMAACLASTAKDIECNIKVMLERLIAAFDLKITDEANPTIGTLFWIVLDELLKTTGKKVVVLIDEYDVPVTNLWDNKEEREKARTVMHDFYVQLKTSDRNIRFLMMTGVSKIAKLSVFSGLNNLIDLTMSSEYATMFGYTEHEIRRDFDEQISAFAVANKIDHDSAIHALLNWYDSYRFSPQATSTDCVCNPVSIGKALSERRIKNYWTATGNTTVIYKALRGQLITPLNLDGIIGSEADLEVSPIERLNVPALFFQTGYLTIKNRCYDGKLELGIPNQEVKEALTKGFLDFMFSNAQFDFVARADVAKKILDKMQSDVSAVLKEILYGAFAALPYEWKCDNEAEAKRMFLFFVYFLGADIRGEQESAIGRADAILELAHAIYIFEFKYDGSSQAAYEQAVERKYADRYIRESRPVYLVGVNYSSETRNIDAPFVAQADFSQVWDVPSDDSSDE